MTERVKQYLSNPLRCFKCQEYGHHKESCREHLVCIKCGQKDTDHMEEDSRESASLYKILRYIREKKKSWRSSIEEIYISQKQEK